MKRIRQPDIDLDPNPIQVWYDAACLLACYHVVEYGGKFPKLSRGNFPEEC